MTRHIATFVQARKALEAYWPDQVYRPVFDLTYMRQLMTYLGNPQEQFKTIHVAGTSGKTSTVYYAAALLKAAGKKVGHTVSPHVYEVNERVQIGLEPLPEAEFCADLSKFLDLVDKSDIPTTYFELLVAFSYWEFARRGVDYAVVEVGVGGINDGTNVIKRADKVCVITDIGMDHMQILGTTIPEIAEKKAGIIQQHNPVFCYRQSAEIMSIITAQSSATHADLHIIDAVPDISEASGLPLFQRRNLGLSTQAVRFALERDGEQLTNEAIAEATRTYIPARMETRRIGNKTLIMDGAHNSQKLGTLVNSIGTMYPGQKAAALISFVNSRADRLEPAVAELLPLVSHGIVTAYGDGSQDSRHSSLDPEVIREACVAVGLTDVEVIADAKQAVDTLLARPEDLLLVTGSFYYMALIRPLLP